MKHFLFVIVIISFIVVGIHISQANETLPGSFTVVEDDPTPVISNLGLYRSTGQLINPNSGSMIPNTRHSIRFNVSNDYFSLNNFSVRIALFQTDVPTIEAFNQSQTNASGDAFVVRFSDSTSLDIEYQDGFDSNDHSFDDQFFNQGLDKITVIPGTNSYNFEIYFNLSKVASYGAPYFIGVEFTQFIEGQSYEVFQSSGAYIPNAYTEINLVPTTLAWSLSEGETFEVFNYTSESSQVIIPSSNIRYISNRSFDLDMYSDGVWKGQDLDDPNNVDAIVEAYLSANPTAHQTFGLKVNTTGIPNSGVQIQTIEQVVAWFNATNEYGSFGINIYVFLGIFGDNFQNGSYSGNLYLIFTQ